MQNLIGVLGDLLENIFQFLDTFSLVLLTSLRLPLGED